MSELPIIRLEMQQMKHTIITALTSHQLQINQYVDVTLQRAIDEFDYDSVVKQSVDEAITDAIKSYFKYGDGRKVIEAAVKQALMIREDE